MLSLDAIIKSGKIDSREQAEFFADNAEFYAFNAEWGDFRIATAEGYAEIYGMLYQHKQSVELNPIPSYPQRIRFCDKDMNPLDQ